MANISLGGQQLSPSGQNRIQLARSLLGQGASGAPVQSVTQGLNRLAQGFLGGRLTALQRGEEQERQQALADTLRRVTQAGQQGTVTGPGGGGTGEVATADQRIMDALSSNPQTAPMAAQLTLEQALRGPEQISASDLVEIQTQEGARLVPASEAVGREPARDDDSTSRQRQILELVERGFSREDAQDIASGRVDVVSDNFGRTFLVNKATGDRRLVSPERGQPTQEQPEGQPEEQPDTGDLGELGAAAEEGTGPFAAARQFANRTIGPFVEGQPFPETQEARQKLRIFNQQIKQSLTANPRNPVAELKTIQGFLPDPDTVFTDPEGERQNLRDLKNFLSRRRELNQQQLEEAFIPDRERERLAEQNAQIEQAMALMRDFGGPQGEEETVQGAFDMRFERDEQGNLVPVQ